MSRIGSLVITVGMVFAALSLSVSAQAQTPPGKSDAKKGAAASAKKGAQTNNFGGDEWERKGGVKGAKPPSTQGNITAQDDWEARNRK